MRKETKKIVILTLIIVGFLGYFGWQFVNTPLPEPQRYILNQNNSVDCGVLNATIPASGEINVQVNCVRTTDARGHTTTVTTGP